MRITAIVLLVIASMTFAATPHKPRRPTAPVPPQALAEFVYRDLTLRVMRADGTPLAGATIYGFCPDLNLIWPRAGDEADRTGVIVDTSTVQKSGDDGTVKVTVPPGKLGFFAVGRNGKSTLAAWSDFRDRTAGETVTLAPLAQTKHWTLSAPGQDAMKPRQCDVAGEIQATPNRRLHPVEVDSDAVGHHVIARRPSSRRNRGPGRELCWGHRFVRHPGHDAEAMG